MNLTFNISMSLDKLRSKQSRITRRVEQVMPKVALYLEGEVKKSIAGRKDETRSVDTGRFLNSVSSYADGTQAVVFSDVEYAKYLEFGTSKIGARSHFQNTATREAKHVKEVIVEEVRNA